jgi:stage II sporulation protein GA (sporulation sigma-E factor processing peptidase)
MKAAQGGSVMIIYADILVVLNVLTDYLLLRCCSTVRHVPVCRGRLLAGALVGGLSSLQMLLPVQGMAATALSLLSAAAVCLTAFGFGSIRQFLRNGLCFMLLAFAYSAGMYALWFLLHPDKMYWHGGYVYFDISPMHFVVLTLLTDGLLTMSQKWRQNRERKEGRILRIQMTHEGKSTCGRGLADSGNLLREPISGCPVIIADEKLLVCIRPQLAHPEHLTGVDAVCTGFRMVQFHTMNGGGCMAACRVEEITSPDAELLPASALYAAACPGLKERTGWDFILPESALVQHTERGIRNEQKNHAVASSMDGAMDAGRKNGHVHQRCRRTAGTVDGRRGTGDDGATADRRQRCSGGADYP